MQGCIQTDPYQNSKVHRTEQKACKIAMKIDHFGPSLLTHLFTMVTEDNKTLKRMQEATSKTLQPLMNKKCLWLHMGILLTAVTGSLLQLHQNEKAEKESTALNKPALQQMLSHMNTEAFLSEIALARSSSRKTRSELTGIKSHLFEVHVLEMFAGQNNNNKHFLHHREIVRVLHTPASTD